MGKASRWAVWSPARTVTTHHCCAPPWRSSAGSSRCFPTTSGSTSTPATTPKVNRDLLDELGCEWQIQPKCEVIAINHTHRWVDERTNSWYSRGFNFRHLR